MFELGACSVERTREQDYRIRWIGSVPGQRVAIYMADDPQGFYAGAHPGSPVLITTDNDVTIRNPDPTVRHYFYLESGAGEGLILAERQLSLQGTPNLRDLGGYETFDGRRLKWGRLYRSGKLSTLTDPDVHYFRRLGVTLVCDLRQLIEQELEPSRLGQDSAHISASLPVSPGSSQHFLENLHRGILEVDDAAGLMREINREFVSNQMPRYAEMFRLLLSADHQVLIHCASGKDRTGFGSALILDVLGVDEESIVEDYLLSNSYLAIDEEVERLSGQLTDQAGSAVSPDVLRPLLEVRPEYLLAALEEIRTRFRSKSHFYETALDLDESRIALLRERYLH